MLLFWWYTHNTVVALGADETSFAAIVGASVLVVLHASVKFQSFAQRFEVENAVEVDPFAAVMRPGLAAIGFLHITLQKFLFELLKMLAHHESYYGTGKRRLPLILFRCIKWRIPKENSVSAQCNKQISISKNS